MNTNGEVPVVRPGAAAAGITFGCVGVLMLGLQPLLLAALLGEHRISFTQLSLSATLEQLLIGVVTGALGAFAPRRHLRLWGCVGCAVLAIANAGCVEASGLNFVVLRALSGVGGGILLWIATCIITFSRSPARLMAIFVGAQAASQCVLAALLPVTLMPSFGANGGLATLAGVSLLSIALARLLPSSVPKLVKEAIDSGRLGLGAYAGLLASFLLTAAIVGFWVFVEPLGAASGTAASILRFAVAFNLAAQVGGAVLAYILAPRLIPVVVSVVAGCCGLLLLAMVLVYAGLPEPAFIIAVMFHGVVWTVSLAFYVPLLIRIDPTRRGAMLLPGAQLLGGSAGPLITGWFATETRLVPVLMSAGLLTLVSLASTVVASVVTRAKT
jgi:DHA1 family inner membrane transport protein